MSEEENKTTLLPYPENKPTVGKSYLVQEWREEFSVKEFKYEWDNEWRSVVAYQPLPKPIK